MQRAKLDNLNPHNFTTEKKNTTELEAKRVTIIKKKQKKGHTWIIIMSIKKGEAEEMKQVVFGENASNEVSFTFNK